MRSIQSITLILAAGALLGGCAIPPRAQPLAPTQAEARISAQAPVTAGVGKPVYDDAQASALVFAPPAAQDEPPLALWRDAREPSAFIGFESPATLFNYTQTWDEQSSCGDYYDRWSVSGRMNQISR